MYANAPHASTVPSPMAPIHPQQAAPAQVQHGLPPGVPTYQPPAGTHAGPGGSATQRAALNQPPAAAPARPAAPAATNYITGAYQAVGDAGIDRMLRLEAACKQFGSPL